MSILTHTTPVALWHEVVHAAEASCSVILKDELEAYLVFLLMRYMNKPMFVKEIMAIEFLQGMQLKSTEQILALQEVGDKCLLLTGLYPNLAEKRLVHLSYFVKLGQAAYAKISQKSNDLYELLGHQFVGLMDILQSIRHYSQHYPDLLPLQAYEQWHDTGSQRAWRILGQYTAHSQALPVFLKK